ncbi:MAG TPA: hypothetical protein VM529_17060, partial [Gemmata sp.]|nr:hypothetical protein [Gemmata sp.]
MARRRGIRGWDSMDKGALVKALSRPAPSAAKIKKPAKLATKKPRAAQPTKPAKPAAKSAAKVTRPVKSVAKPAAAPRV